ncbi:hypothetical protein NJ76_31580 [Rhodococcus sp. IITR03]|nr:hypothetical protein NJ76_31580 [Rhodococcus sp. IITR03]
MAGTARESGGGGGDAAGDAACDRRRPHPPYPGDSCDRSTGECSEVVGDITRLLPARQDGQGRWLCDNTIRTAHLAGLIGRSAIAVVPPGAVDGDRVELLPLPR